MVFSMQLPSKSSMVRRGCEKSLVQQYVQFLHLLNLAAIQRFQRCYSNVLSQRYGLHQTIGLLLLSSPHCLVLIQNLYSVFLAFRHKGKNLCRAIPYFFFFAISFTLFLPHLWFQILAQAPSSSRTVQHWRCLPLPYCPLQYRTCRTTVSRRSRP